MIHLVILQQLSVILFQWCLTVNFLLLKKPYQWFSCSVSNDRTHMETACDDYIKQQMINYQ